MNQPSRALASNAALVDAVDFLLNRGAVLVGETTLSLAGVDLVYVGLNLLVSSVETLPLGEAAEGGPAAGAMGAGGTSESRPGLARELPVVGRPSSSLARALPQQDPRWYAAQAAPSSPAGPPTPLESGDAPERGVEQGLAQLVLTLIELLRQVLERQALRRVEGGRLDDDQIERIGVALMELDAKMDELCALFEIGRDELNVDLGPVGLLLS